MLSMMLSLADINPVLLSIDCGAALKLEEHQDRLLQLNHELMCGSTIHDLQAGRRLGQKAITFVRQVAALTEYPPLIELGKHLFPADVIARAKELIAEVESLGAYSHCQGVPFIRRNIANFIEQRDGFPTNPSNIFLTAGISEAVSLFINMLISTSSDGILIPMPPYPLYTATLAQHNGVAIPYFLCEISGWSSVPDNVERAIENAIAKGTKPKGLVVVNPASPTAPILTESIMDRLVRIAEKHSLVLLADEVHQCNYTCEFKPFTSFKKIVVASKSHIPLISFHSISKGISGECGRRGGYFELTNIAPDIQALIYKIRCLSMCAPIAGQIGVDCLVRPPKPGEASYALWKEETDAVYMALAGRTMS